MIKPLIRRWQWLQAWRKDLEWGIQNPNIRAEFIQRYNSSRFWWIKELKDEA